MDLITCPSAKEIQQYLRGEAQDQQAEQILDHIKGCSRCLQTVAQPRWAPAEKSRFHETVTAGGHSIDEGALSPLTDCVETDALAFLAPAVGPDELGWLANYRVLKVLGEGGMGMVLMAEDMHLQRPVAVKVMKPDVGGFADSRGRFMREATAMAQVKSEHVVTIHQVGEFNDTCFIAMEMLEGESLDNYMERETEAPLADVLRIGREIALALDAAHKKGLVHRDIKPENVWLEAPRAHVKLLDFGLARPYLVNDKLTQTGQILGTPSYMSPEQARALDIDDRSDLWALGCLLYQLLCGQKPFQGPTLLATLMAIVEHTPQPPSELRKNLPQGLDALIMRLLAKDRDERWQSAGEVIAAITEMERSLPADHDRRPSPPREEVDLLKSGRFTTRTISGAGFTGGLAVDREAEKRQVSVVTCCCDLFDAEGYLELGNDEQGSILSALLSACRDTVLACGGTLVQNNDEYLLACFGYPVAHEEATVLAAKCSLALLHALEDCEKSVLAPHGLSFAARIAVHSGPAVLEMRGVEVSLAGDARKIALRLGDLAAEGQVVCSETALRLLRGKFDCDDLGQQKVRGSIQPINIFAIKAEKAIPDMVTEQAAPGGLVGRELELSLLKDRWAQVREGQGQVVLLGGEAGVGKSFLVGAIKAHVKAQMQTGENCTIIEWYCSPHSRNSSLRPATLFFEQLLQLDSEDSEAVRYKRLVDYLGRYGLARADLVPVFAALLNLPAGDDFPSLALSPARERDALFSALIEWLRVYSANQTVMFVIEDLHWLDDSTVQFLERFFAEGLNEQILTVLTFRPEFRVPWGVHSQQTLMSLSRLGKEQAGHLVRRIAGRKVPEEAIAQICDRAGGVPLFIEEFTKMMLESGVLDDSGGRGVKTLMAHAIPTTLQELVMARLDRLEGDINLAQMASAIGRTFSFEMLREVSGLDDAALQTQLAKFVQGELLIEKGRAPKSTYVFKHVLLQDALYNALVKARRRQYHQNIGEALERRNDKAGDVMPELLAHHFTEAGMLEKSIVHWLAAGLRAQEIFANKEAISHFTAGLNLLATLPATSDRDNSELLFLNPLGAAYQATLGYSAPVVGPLFSRARDLCIKVGQPWQVFVVMWGNWTYHLVKGDLALCIELADEMVSFAASTGDSGMLMEAYVAPAVTRFYRGDYIGCIAHCRTAIDSHESEEECRLWSGRTGQNSAVVTRCYLANALLVTGRFDQAREVLDEMMTMARKIQHPFSLGHALHFASWFYQLSREGDKLQATASEQILLATQQGYALWQASGTFLKGAGAFLQGLEEDGLQAMICGVRAFRGINAVLTLPAQLVVLAESYIKVGNWRPAKALLQEALLLTEKYDDRGHEAELYRLMADVFLTEHVAGSPGAAGAEQSAEKWLEKATATASRQGAKTWGLRAAMSFANLRRRQGHADEGARHLSAVFGAIKEGADLPDMIDAARMSR